MISNKSFVFGAGSGIASSGHLFSPLKIAVLPIDHHGAAPRSMHGSGNGVKALALADAALQSRQTGRAVAL
jgi:hypothetical protein